MLGGQTGLAGGNGLITDLATWTSRFGPGPVRTVRFTGQAEGVKDVELWLPHNEVTEVIALRTDAAAEPAPDRGRRVWLHHGSSISHGFDAQHPTGAWPAVAASLGGVGLINLAFGSNALLDPFTAREMRGHPG